MQGKLYRGYEQCREKNCIARNTNTNPTGKQLQYLFESIKMATAIISSPGNINQEWLGQTLFSSTEGYLEAFGSKETSLCGYRGDKVKRRRRVPSTIQGRGKS